MAQPGRTCRYRHAALTLPADLQVPTFQRCKHMLLSIESVPELATALEATSRAKLVQRAAIEIINLGRAYSQPHIEVPMNLSQGCRCRPRSADGAPSFALVSLPALLRAQRARLEELKRDCVLPPEPLPVRVYRKRCP